MVTGQASIVPSRYPEGEGNDTSSAVPRKDRGFDPDNLLPACLDCNADKARAEQAYPRKGYDVRFITHDPELHRWLRLSYSATNEI